MPKPKLLNDPAADRLWRQCRHEADLRWLLESVLSARNPEVGRILLLSPVEVFGEIKVPMGRKLSLLFRLTGFPYLSATIKELSQSLKKMSGRGGTSRQGDPKQAIADWARDNGPEAHNRIAAAVLETVRRNAPLRALATADQPVTPVGVAQSVKDFGALDCSAIEELLHLFEPFLARSRSKKHINRFTLNFTALLPYVEPGFTQWDVILRSAVQFAKLLAKRRVSERGWRDLLLKLIDRDLVAPSTSMFLWCRRFPEDGFVASAPFALAALPPLCPSCGKDAHAMASFAPARGFRDAMLLKDGLLGAAIGWHLTSWQIRFWHARCERGTEMDFIAIVPDGHLLIECKMLSVSTGIKQLARTLCDAIKQLDEHAALLHTEGWKIRHSACVVNLIERDLVLLRRKGFLANSAAERLVSYEEFRNWLRGATKR